MSLLNGIKRHFIIIFDYSSQREPVVIVSTLVLPSQRAGKGDCDVIGRVPKSQYTMNTVFFLK